MVEEHIDKMIDDSDASMIVGNAVKRFDSPPGHMFLGYIILRAAMIIADTMRTIHNETDKS